MASSPLVNDVGGGRFRVIAYLREHWLAIVVILRKGGVHRSVVFRRLRNLNRL
eukprot:XP_001704824.1 Hypothetical protein GL50803_32453 [Giardia lamblia ATCC 50803]